MFDESLQDEVRVTVVATGFGATSARGALDQPLAATSFPVTPVQPSTAGQATPASEPARPQRDATRALEAGARALRDLGDSDIDIPTFLRPRR